MKKLMKAVATLMLMMICLVNCTKNAIDNSGSLNGHDFVDLGLPSGTLWATCNVGANTPEGCGTYFAWGETCPKRIYDWSTYKYCNNGDYMQLTKYCHKSSYGFNGFTDDVTQLEPSDDAATMNWGDDWCIPTFDQWRELYVNNTVIIDTTLNGVNGKFFAASNGNSIFLPATGVFCLNSINYGDSYCGNYWSSSLNGFSPTGAMGFWEQSFSREWGLTIRPVRSIK
ncbi:MAG: hypothetical protein IKW82_05140 [Bacteroidales bacterium]|jgi:hypothetical protein|nr:hypothetical protein [Bacteroidales bacterium]